jgi:1-acyl-sn-glycerol-3-phosphate acyltransferase/membrane-associated phospholipid phosphatase
MTRLAARRSALLSVLFLAVYGGCNWITAQRTDVGVWYFDWERSLPFWPLLIVPYLSIDAFFVAAPFLCRTRRELRVYSWRITAAIVMAGVCFAAMPLRFAFDRPATDGWLGWLIGAFAAFDRPFNLFPSLHITLAVILADVYRRHTAGIARGVLMTWFVLIGASTVFTYQHHVIDVAGGLILATLVFYLVREPAVRPAAARNFRVAACYLVGATTATALAAALWPAGSVLLWPALSLLIAGVAYAGIGPWIFGKVDGRVPLAARLLLWPCLLGQRASLAWYRRQCRPWDVVAPHVWLGRQLSEREAADLVQAGVRAVVDLTPDFDRPRAFRGTPYLNLQTLDLTAPHVACLDSAVRFITRHSRRGVVFVHCKIGYSRSAAALGAYLLSSGRARTIDQALGLIRRARPQVVIRPEVAVALREYHDGLLGSGRSRSSRPTPGRLAVMSVLAGAARLICGSRRWAGCTPESRPRIYFANHTSHLDFLAVWGALPPELRATTRPVAGRDYWGRDSLRRFVARRVIRAVLVDRTPPGQSGDREATVATARRSVKRAVRALATGASLIIFPEGTRGDGSEVGPFKSGLYHLCRARPDVELVPVFLENLHRILPKGEFVPLPLSGSVTFGAPIRLRPGESKGAFLARARAGVLRVNRPCPSLSTVWWVAW